MINKTIISSLAKTAKRAITYNKSQCIDCGNCASACISQALSMGKPDWKLTFKPEKCVFCKLCLKSCPLQLFKLSE